MKPSSLLTLATSTGIALTTSMMGWPPTSSADPTIAPCDWVTVEEASSLLREPVHVTTGVDGFNSVGASCYYDTAELGTGVTSDLLGPDRFPVNAAAQYAQWTTDNAIPVDGLGHAAKCLYSPMTTPPTTTLLVLLDGNRMYRAIGGYEYCDTLTAFAHIAIRRIGE